MHSFPEVARRVQPVCIIALLFLALQCASKEIRNQYDSCAKISVGPGTEDFALNPATGLLYVSSHDRRVWKNPGEIFAVNTKSREVQKLARTGEPADLFFAPHGVDLLTRAGTTFLYVVNHGREQNDANQTILVYRLQANSLQFIAGIRHTLINSPNDLAVDSEGNFYVANDHGSRGSLWEMFWGLKRSNLVYCRFNPANPGQETLCTVAVESIGMANAPFIRGDKVYLTATREDKVYEFTRAADGSLSGKRLVVSVDGPDNLSWSADHLITASHTSNWKFFRHVSSASNLSPSLIVTIDVAQGKADPLYFNDGSEISAASGALVHNGRLYIAQVFEDFILECRPVQ